MLFITLIPIPDQSSSILTQKMRAIRVHPVNCLLNVLLPDVHNIKKKNTRAFESQDGIIGIMNDAQGKLDLF